MISANKGYLNNNGGVMWESRGWESCAGNMIFDRAVLMNKASTFFHYLVRSLIAFTLGFICWLSLLSCYVLVQSCWILYNSTSTVSPCFHPTAVTGIVFQPGSLAAERRRQRREGLFMRRDDSWVKQSEFPLETHVNNIHPSNNRCEKQMNSRLRERDTRASQKSAEKEDKRASVLMLRRTADRGLKNRPVWP